MPRYSSSRDLRDGLDVRPQFSRDGAVVDIPRRRMAEQSVDPETAYNVIKDELMLDGHARLNDGVSNPPVPPRLSPPLLHRRLRPL